MSQGHRYKELQLAQPRKSAWRRPRALHDSGPGKGAHLPVHVEEFRQIIREHLAPPPSFS